MSVESIQMRMLYGEKQMTWRSARLGFLSFDYKIWLLNTTEWVKLVEKHDTATNFIGLLLCLYEQLYLSSLFSINCFSNIEVRYKIKDRRTDMKNHRSGHAFNAKTSYFPHFYNYFNHHFNTKPSLFYKHLKRMIYGISTTPQAVTECNTLVYR